jgi:hypothetical protein
MRVTDLQVGKKYKAISNISGKPGEGTFFVMSKIIQEVYTSALCEVDYIDPECEGPIKVMVSGYTEFVEID